MCDPATRSLWGFQQISHNQKPQAAAECGVRRSIELRKSRRGAFLAGFQNQVAQFSVRRMWKSCHLAETKRRKFPQKSID
jgi:hypothetical protein